MSSHRHCGSMSAVSQLLTLTLSRSFVAALRVDWVTAVIYLRFLRLPENSGKYCFPLKFPGPGRSWKMSLALESPGN